MPRYRATWESYRDGFLEADAPDVYAANDKINDLYTERSNANTLEFENVADTIHTFINLDTGHEEDPWASDPHTDRAIQSVRFLKNHLGLTPDEMDAMDRAEEWIARIAKRGAWQQMERRLEAEDAEI